jgi:type II secretory pathway pseudopilin PulG
MELLVVLVIMAALAALVVGNVDHARDDAETTAARALMQTVREALAGSPSAPGYLSDMKYAPGFHSVNLRVHDLFSPSGFPQFSKYVVEESRGWRGPYLKNAQGAANTNSARNGLFPEGNERRFTGDATYSERGFFYDGSGSHYGLPGDFVAADPWGNPVVIQVPPGSAFSGAIDDAGRFRYTRLVSAGADGILSTPRDRLAGMLADGTAAARGDDLVLFLNRADAYEEP